MIDTSWINCILAVLSTIGLDMGWLLLVQNDRVKVINFNRLFCNVGLIWYYVKMKWLSQCFVCANECELVNFKLYIKYTQQQNVSVPKTNQLLKFQYISFCENTHTHTQTEDYFHNCEHNYIHCKLTILPSDN